MRLDELLHKKVQPRWVMQNKHAVEFIRDFVPMLELSFHAFQFNVSLT
jgi:hypothetical protein